MSAEQEDDPDELSPALTLCWHIVVGVPTCTYTTLLKLYFCAHGSFSGACKRELPLAK